MQDLLSTALDSPTGKLPLNVPTCSAPSPRRLRAARRLATTERRIKGRCALAPARAAAGRLRSACAHRLCPRACAVQDQGARGVEGEGGNAPGQPRLAQLRRKHASSSCEGQLEYKIYSQLRRTRPLASCPWTCPPAQRRLCAERRQAASELRIKAGPQQQKKKNHFWL